MSDSSDLEDSYVEAAVQDEFIKRDWETRHQRGNKTAQLLLLGAGIAIAGLLISFVLLCFRTNCGTDMRQGSYVKAHSGRWEMCKTGYKRFKMDDPGFSEVDGEVIEIAGTACKVDSDCAADWHDQSAVEHAFCHGGPHEIYEAGYCQTHTCTCKTVIYNCGTENYFEWQYTPAEVVQNCTANRDAATKCHQNLTIKVPLWKINGQEAVGASTHNWLGCKWQSKSELLDVMFWIQQAVGESGITQPLLPAGEPIWNHVKLYLSDIPDVQFISFWPSTISESVSNGFSPEGRIFFGFMLCAALCLLISHYTNEVVTVELPGKVLPLIGVSWNTMRAWLPPIGLILLSTVQMVPTSEIVNFSQALMTAVHLIGAQFCFVVYLVCEATALIDPVNKAEMEPGERKIRSLLCIVGSIAMVTFAVTYGILLFFSGSEFTPYVMAPFTGKSDMYKFSFSLQRSLLVRPAEGQWRAIKVTSYIAEYSVAMSILLSHLVIWFYFKKTLEEPFKSGSRTFRVESVGDDTPFIENDAE